MSESDEKFKNSLLGIKDDLTKSMIAVDFLLNIEQPKFEEIPFPMIIENEIDIYNYLSVKSRNRLKFFLDKDNVYLKNMPVEDIKNFNFNLFIRCRDVGYVTFNEVKKVFESKINYMI